MKYMAQSADYNRISGVLVNTKAQTVELHGLIKSGVVTPEQLGLVKLVVYPAAYATDPEGPMSMPTILYVHRGSVLSVSVDRSCGLTRYKLDGENWRYALYVHADGGGVEWHDVNPISAIEPWNTHLPGSLGEAVRRRKTALFRRASRDRIEKMRNPPKPDVIRMRMKAKHKRERADRIAVQAFFTWCNTEPWHDHPQCYDKYVAPRYWDEAACDLLP